jgi:hypothetical protein
MQWSPGFVLNQVKHLGQCQMLLGASLDIVSLVWVWHTGQVTVQTVTTPFHAGLLNLGLANIRPTDPTSATNPKAKQLDLRNSRRLLLIDAPSGILVSYELIDTRTSKLPGALIKRKRLKRAVYNNHKSKQHKHICSCPLSAVAGWDQKPWR